MVGEDDELGNPKVYIGEAEHISKRLGSRQHASRDFWVSVIAFVSKDQNLTKAHIKYIEGQLIGRGQALGVDLENSQSSGASLPESDTADMQFFLSRMYQLLPVLGVRCFEEPQRVESGEDDWLYCKIKGLRAKGRRTASGFVVVEGSEAVLEHRASAVGSARRRDQLIERGILVPNDDHLVFSRDWEFSSPSAAGTAVRGGATNGLKAWKSKSGISLKELESS